MKKFCEDILKKSFEELLKNDYELLENNIHEITVSNILSRYINNFINTSHLVDMSVDIEYNRMLDENNHKMSKQSSKAFYIQKQVSKAIYITSFDCDRQDLHELIKIYIRPDIIVHQRGINSNNLLWIELKVNTNEEECRYDMQKTWYAISQLQYKFGVSILIDINKKSVIFHWIYNSENERVEFEINDNIIKERSRVIFPYTPQ